MSANKFLPRPDQALDWKQDFFWLALKSLSFSERITKISHKEVDILQGG